MHRNFPLLLFFFHSFFHCFFVLFPLLLFSFCSFRLPYTKLKKIVLASSLYILLPFYCCFFASISIKVFNFLFYLFSIGFSSFQQHFPILKFSFVVFQKMPQCNFGFLAFLRYLSHHNIFKLYFRFNCSKIVVC